MSFVMWSNLNGRWRVGLSSNSGYRQGSSVLKQGLQEAVDGSLSAAKGIQLTGFWLRTARPI